MNDIFEDKMSAHFIESEEPDFGLRTRNFLYDYVMPGAVAAGGGYLGWHAAAFMTLNPVAGLVIAALYAIAYGYAAYHHRHTIRTAVNNTITPLFGARTGDYWVKPEPKKNEDDWHNLRYEIKNIKNGKRRFPERRDGLWRDTFVSAVCLTAFTLLATTGYYGVANVFASFMASAMAIPTSAFFLNRLRARQTYRWMLARGGPR
jgi:hypothetical protein